MAQKKKIRFNRQLKVFIRNTLPQAVESILHAQKAAEVEGGPRTGAEKLEVAVGWLNAVVDIPLLPEWVEELIFKALITSLVEVAKHLWGERKWFDQLTGVFGVGKD